jgi:hypothetical protein
MSKKTALLAMLSALIVIVSSALAVQFARGGGAKRSKPNNHRNANQ